MPRQERKARAQASREEVSNYARGATFERKIMADLENEGWVVIRSAASHGTTDLVALKEGKIPLLIQCKINCRLDPDEWNGLMDDAEKGGAIPLLIERPKRGQVRAWRLCQRKSKGFHGEVSLWAVLRSLRW